MKRLFILALFLLACGFVARDMDRYRPAGLVAGYSFNDASGRDASGYGATMTASGDAVYTSGFVSVSGAGYASGSDITSKLGAAYSVSCWAYFDDLAANRAVIDSTVSGGGADTFTSIQFRVIYIQSTGVIRGQVRDDVGNTNFVDAAFSSAGTWAHFGLVRNGNAVTLYVNGSSAGTSSAASIGAFASSHYFTVGAVRNISPTPLSNYHVGDVDDFRVFNRALTAAEIAQIYNSGRTPR